MGDSTTFTGLTIGEAEKRRDRAARFFSWGMVAGVGFVLAPIAFSILTAIVALLVAAGLALAAVTLAPVVAMKLANWRMAEILAEARRNPMPTLENDLLMRKEALATARASLLSIIGKVKDYVADADEWGRQYPEDAAIWCERARQVQMVADSRKRAYSRACQAVEDFEVAVKRCRSEWKLAVLDTCIRDSLDASNGIALATLQSTTAIDAVKDRVNAAFAGLELELLEEGEVNRIMELAPVRTGSRSAPVKSLPER